MIIENYSALFPLVGAILNLCLFSYILSVLKTDRKGLAFIFYVVAAIFWQLLDAIVWSPISDSALRSCFLIMHLPILAIGPLFLYFIYVLLGRKQDIYIYIFYVLFGINFIITFFTDLMYKDVVRTDWGVFPDPGPLHFLSIFVAMIGPVLLGLTLLVIKYVKTNDTILKKQIMLSIIGVSLTWLCVSFFDLVVPHVLENKDFPQIGSAVLSIQSFFFFLAVVKYRFLSVSIHQAAHEIFSQINDGVVLVDRYKNIANINEYFCEILGIKTLKELSKNIIEEIQEKWIKKTDYSDLEIEYNSNNTSKDLLVSQASLIQHGMDVGKLIIARDVTEIRRAQSEKERMLHQLAQGAHQAGMAEIAANTLHNFGNMLNSVNVAVQLIEEKTNKTRLPSLLKAIDLFSLKKKTSGEYLFDQEKGQIFLNYIENIHKVLKKEREEISVESQRLKKHIRTMEKALITQNKYVHTNTQDESIEVSKFIDEILDMKKDIIEKNSVAVQNQSQLNEKVFFRAQRSKISHVMTSLISNSIEALEENPAEERKLIIDVYIQNSELFLSVQDNGCGIDPDNLEEIFRYGYSTKHDHEGLGLHIASIYTKEMGGRMLVSSDGLGKGAQFQVIFDHDSWNWEGSDEV